MKRNKTPRNNSDTFESGSAIVDIVELLLRFEEEQKTKPRVNCESSRNKVIDCRGNIITL